MIAVLVLAGLLANAGPVATNDIGIHLRIGQEIAASGPPHVDNHSFTVPNAPYPAHEWLAQLGLWGLYAAAGVPGLAAAQGLLIGLTLALVAYAVRGPTLLRVAALVPVLLLSFDHSEIRPHLLGWAYVAALGILLERRRHGWVLALLWLWANTHASVLLGVGLAGLTHLETFARARTRQPLIWAAAVALVPLLNPYGIHVYTLFFQITANADFVGEWQPYGTDTWQFFLLLVLVALATFGLFRARFNPFDAVRLLVLATLSFQSSRSGIVMAIFLAPTISRWYQRDVEHWSLRTRRVLTLLIAAVFLVACGQRWRAGEGMRFELDRTHLPVAAVEFLQRHRVSGALYNDYNFGGYLLWKAPEIPVFVDGRIEVYQGRVLDDHLSISRAEPGWQAVVERYGVEVFLVRPERSITAALLQDPNWGLVYFDYNAAIFVRADLWTGLRRLTVISPSATATKPPSTRASPR